MLARCGHWAIHRERLLSSQFQYNSLLWSEPLALNKMQCFLRGGGGGGKGADLQNGMYLRDVPQC